MTNATRRPTAIGLEINIDSLATADLALCELVWLASEQTKLESSVVQMVETLKRVLAKRLQITIGGEPVSIPDRIAALQQALEEWTAANIGPLLEEGKKTRTLAHGELGLRQLPLVIECDDGDDGKPYKPAEVLAWIKSEGLKKSQQKLLTETKTTLHLKGAKDAYTAGKITADELAAVGLVVREAHDVAVVKPAKVAVTTEG